MLTLQNFETRIHSTILQRGRQYFADKAVAWLEDTGNNKWRAAVEGTDTYQVDVSLKNNDEISSYSCDCPYDDDLCKHVVAVFFALRKELIEGKGHKRNAEKETFDRLLQAVSQEEYQAFIRRYALKNREFRADFVLYFAGKDDRADAGKKYKEAIRKIIRNYSVDGYIDYRDENAFSREINQLLDIGRDLYHRNDFRDAFAIGRVVLVEMMKVLSDNEEADYLSHTIADAIQLIHDLATAGDAPAALKEEVFAFVQKKLKDPGYLDYSNIGEALVAVFQALAIQLNKADVFLSFIDEQLPNLTGPYDKSEKEYYQTLKIDTLRAMGKTAEAENLIWENMDIVAVRQGEVDKAIASKDYAAAKALVAEGIRVAETLEEPATVTSWQKELLRLAVLENDTKTIRHYARYFAFKQGFDQAYYQQWRAAYTPQEWPAVIDKWIAKTIESETAKWNSQKAQAWRRPHPPLLQKLGPVYIQERYWDRLLALVQQENDLNTTLNYHRYLVPHYPAELLSLYLPALERYGEHATGRADYAMLVTHMQMVMKAIPAGKEQILALARQLIAQYRRRPAMVEELNQLLVHGK